MSLPASLCFFFYGPASNLFITTVPYVVDTDCQLTVPVYAVFSPTDLGLPMPTGHINEITALILIRNGIFQRRLRDWSSSVHDAATVLMNEPGEGMKFAVFKGEGF
jgi:hypothetical protein